MMDKAALRMIALRARKTLPPEDRARASERICERLPDMPELRAAAVIFSYLAMPEEVNLTRLHDRLRADGKTVAFPVIGAHGSMEAYVPDESMRFGRDRFGILAPSVASARRIDPAEISLVLTPCVAFDAACRRLGHGGGYYDRYFPRCPKALRVCAAFEVQRLPEIPVEPWDAEMHAVVTEAGIYLPK